MNQTKSNRTGSNQVCHRIKHYTSDLSDSQWRIIQLLLPIDQNGTGRRLEINMREAVNGILYISKTGCHWENLPGEFPHYQSGYYHFRKWCLDDTWERVNRALVYEARQAGRAWSASQCLYYEQSKCENDWSWRATQLWCWQKSEGTKTTYPVDTVGHLLKVVVHLTNIQQRDGAKLLLLSLLPILRLSLLKIWTEGGYRGTLIAWCCQILQTILEIVSPTPAQKGFAVLPRRWVIDRTFAWLGHYRRLSKDCEECMRSSEGMIYLASIHILLKSLAL